MNPNIATRVDIVVKTVGVIFVVISGTFALWQYSYAQEREFKKSFFEKQLTVITEVFDVLSEMDAAKTDEQKQTSAAKFWSIYHGKARAFLDTKMFHALQPSAEYVAGCVTKVRPNKTIPCENSSATMTSAGFARVAREQMSQVWSLSFSTIAHQDPWLNPEK